MSRSVQRMRSPGPKIAAWVLPELAAALRAGAIILLVGRASTEHGRRAAALAVQNLLTAANHLATVLGLEVRHRLPSKQTLVAELRNAPAGDALTNAVTGRPFQVRTLVYTKVPGLVLVIQLGSGVALDDTRLEQPAARATMAAIMEHHPGLVFCTEPRAMVRDGYGVSPILAAMRTQQERGLHPLFYGDISLGVKLFDDYVARHIFDECERGRAEALRGTRRMTTGRSTHTGRRKGPQPWFNWGQSYVPPPPLDTCRIRDVFGSQTDKIAFYDGKSGRPRPEDVASGLPALFEDEARLVPVDQVTLLRWFYRTWLTPGWTTTRTAAYLIAHGYSTASVRHRRKDPTAQPHLRGKRLSSDAHKICHYIWKHNLFHRTGELSLPTGPGGRRERHRFRPPDGAPICRSSDFKRITQALAHSRSIRPAPHPALFAGHPVASVEGVPAALVTETRLAQGGVAYRYLRTDAPGGSRRRHPAVPPLPHAVLAEAIAQAPERELSPWPSIPDDTLEPRQAQLDAAAASLRRLTAERDRMEAEMTSGTWTGDAKQAWNRAFNEAEANVHDAEDALAGLVMTQERDTRIGALPLNRWWSTIVALQHPQDFDHADRMRLREALGPLSISVQRTRRPGHLVEVTVHFAADLRLVDGRGRVKVARVCGEFPGSHAATRGERRTTDLVSAMRAGIGLREAAGPGYREYTPPLRAALGYRPGMTSCGLSIRDPWLLALFMRLMHPPLPADRPTRADRRALRVAGRPLTDAAVRAVAQELGESPALLLRLKRLWAPVPIRQGRWLLNHAVGLASLLHRASTGEVPWRDVPQSLRGHAGARGFLQRTRQGVRAWACPTCGGRDWAHPHIAEIQGLLCRDCHHDWAGVYWPADPYDRYLDPPLTRGS
ncbi:WXG100 family type VII secretion target [Oryzihumus leptocrescens]|uniref:Uncharacterized protein n=1 Tax=Oryzihumus leptocrescens TaxID=297536 RepID=A0A542ZIK5_9MICO|nr:WXG100 family type VII secretion target [Oryzihumus leptocrescens]TQL60129.1 hypothetical protein FB474_1512 [Oryzihumus leptocrescens]